jgi:hypothetical protein
MCDPTFLIAECEEYRRSGDTLTGLYTVLVTIIAFSIKQNDVPLSH